MIPCTLRKISLAAGAVALVAGSSAMAQTTVYGLVDLGYGVNEGATGKGSKADFHSGGDNGNSELNSTTRLGVKGSYDLGSGIKGNFNFQTNGITSSGEVNGVFFNRQAWAGVSGSFGEVRLGRTDSIPFQTQVDYDLNGASNSTSAGANVGVAPWLRGRQSKTLQYIAPAMNGLQVRAGLQLKGNGGATAKDVFGIGANYNAGPLSLGAAYESKRDSAGSDFKSIAGSYNFGAFKVSAGFADGGQDAKGFTLGGETKLGGVTVGLQFADNTDTKKKAYEAYASKELLKNLYGYVQYGQWKDTTDTSLKAYGVGAIFVF